MKKEIFLDKLRESNLSKKMFFVSVAQTDNEMTVVAIENGTQNVLATFRYSEDGIVYRLHLVDGSVYSSKDLINTIYDLTMEED